MEQYTVYLRWSIITAMHLNDVLKCMCSSRNKNINNVIIIIIKWVYFHILFYWVIFS